MELVNLFKELSMSSVKTDSVLGPILQRATQRPQGLAIAAPSMIKSVRKSIRPIIVGLKVPVLTAAERQAVKAAGKPADSDDAYLRLLDARPHLGARRGLTSERWRKVLRKRDGFTALRITIGEARVIAKTGAGQVEASISDKVRTVLEHVGQRIADGRSRTADGRSVKVFFEAVGDELQRKHQQQADAAQRMDRRKAPVQQGIAHEEGRNAVAPQVSRLLQDAAQGTVAPPGAKTKARGKARAHAAKKNTKQLGGTR